MFEKMDELEQKLAGLIGRYQEKLQNTASASEEVEGLRAQVEELQGENEQLKETLERLQQRVGRLLERVEQQIAEAEGTQSLF